MIRTAGVSVDGQAFVMLGVDAQNLDRLREGQPIKVNLRNLDPDGPPIAKLPDLDVVIYFAGADEQRLMAEKFGS